MAKTEVRLLGITSVQRRGAALGPPSLTIQKLLAYLVINRARPSPRSAVSAAMWPDSAEDSSRRRLNTALWRLRKFLNDPQDGAKVIVSSNDEVSMNPAAEVWDDVTEFRSLTAPLQRRAALDVNTAADLESAVRLYRGDILQGCYDDWLIREREQVLERYLRSLHALVNWHHRIGNIESAIQYASQIVAADPLREEVHRVLMRLYSAGGDRSRALRQYDVCVKILAKELGVSPMPETSLLAAQLRHPTSIDVDLRTEDLPELVSRLRSAVRHNAEVGVMLQAAIEAIGPRSDQP